MITHIRVKNFKSWRDSGEVRLAPLTGFFGANSTDRKFIAVAIAYERDENKKATILQALDRKWEPFREAFEQEGVQIDFLCPSENEA